MKISYNVLKKYLPNIASPEEVAQDLIMHTAEVEEIEYEGENLSQVFIGEVLSCEKHSDSEKLNCTKVRVQGKELSIVCGAPNVKAGIKVPVAVVGAQLAPDFVIQKTKIRGEVSEGMICSEDELGLIQERQAGIMILPDDAPLDICVREYFGKNDAVLEIDNKAINHRPDLFSHIGIIREIATIAGEHFDYTYADADISSFPDLGLINEIPDEVSRYTLTAVSEVENINSSQEILDVLGSAECDSKGLLVDVSNYSLYLYGQPTHCFDADTVVGNVCVRYAKDSETFIALNDTEYTLQATDIVIADEEKILALGGIIGGKSSAVTDNTTNILIESAHFHQATLRQTGKRLGLRTDALNVFEKDLQADMAIKGLGLILEELKKHCPNMKITGHSDSYPNPQKQVSFEYQEEKIKSLIGKNYDSKNILTILKNLGITVEGDTLHIPFWRKDMNHMADIAEEVARIDGYNNIDATVPRINLGAVTQHNIYTLKRQVRNFLTLQGYFDLYTYSFVNAPLMEKLGENTDHLVEMKNALSEEMTHLRGSTLPHLLSALEKNKLEHENLKLFEIEKVFQNNGGETSEMNELTGVMMQDGDTLYYDLQSDLSDMLSDLGVSKFEYKKSREIPNYAHSGRIADIIARGQKIGVIGEIHPKVLHRFDLKKKVAFFRINADTLASMIHSLPKANEVSEFQQNRFDINFVVDKDTAGSDIQRSIEKTDAEIIQSVELFDIFESEEKLPGKRSLTFKITIQSLEKTLDDTVKNELIEKIVANVAKKGGTLR
ncbi:phenylalanine--tRNA ligase subunit beta [Candidatus Gracilibacteria bacterium]|nr:phenylalanine--tRNA ligase subunit beta [Candidatus Gracilibacteria bacterium]